MSDTPEDDMADRADPIDTAYVQAEAVLADDAARAARRARLLAAVASEPVPAAAQPPRPVRRDGGWGRGGWLAAACVAGLSVFVVIQIYRPVPRQPHTAPAAALPAAAPATPAAATSKPADVHVAPPRAAIKAPLPTLPAPPSAPPPPPPAAPPPAVADEPAPPATNSAADSASSTTVAEDVVTTRRPAPAPPPRGSAGSSAQAGVGEVVVTAERRTQSIQKVPVAISAFSDKQRDLARSSAQQSFQAAQIDHAAALRAAAAAGQATEVEEQLKAGAPVDAPDANGDTALILSIRADQPDVAAVLRQHGASLDHRNHAGQSARDLAKAGGDEAIGRALGLDR